MEVTGEANTSALNEGTWVSPRSKNALSKGKKAKQPKPGPVVAQGLSSVYLNDTDKLKKRLKDGHSIVIKGRSSTAGKLPLLLPADELYIIKQEKFRSGQNYVQVNKLFFCYVLFNTIIMCL